MILLIRSRTKTKIESILLESSRRHLRFFTYDDDIVESHLGTTALAPAHPVCRNILAIKPRALGRCRRFLLVLSTRKIELYWKSNSTSYPFDLLSALLGGLLPVKAESEAPISSNLFRRLWLKPIYLEVHPLFHSRFPAIF